MLWVGSHRGLTSPQRGQRAVAEQRWDRVNHRVDRLSERLLRSGVLLTLGTWGQWKWLSSDPDTGEPTWLVEIPGPIGHHWADWWIWMTVAAFAIGFPGTLADWRRARRSPTCSVRCGYVGPGQDGPAPGPTSCSATRPTPRAPTGPSFGVAASPPRSPSPPTSGATGNGAGAPDADRSATTSPVQAAQHRRARVQHLQELARHRHSLRQARPNLPSRNHARHHLHLAQRIGRHALTSIFRDLGGLAGSRFC